MKKSLKYAETKATFSEVPEEVTLCINITNCPFKCDGCHSPHLQEDKGLELNEKTVVELMQMNAGITCVCIMGGDADVEAVKFIAVAIKAYNPAMRVAWYSGNDTFPEGVYDLFDYIKTGHYDKDKGPLDCKTTNQRMYKRTGDKWTDITYKFQNKTKI